jgi:TolA-binding protein
VLALALGAGWPGRALAADAAEQKLLEETRERYADRMREFADDARRIVEQTEDDEREKIRSSYGNAMRRLEDEEGKTRLLAISKIENFLGKYPSSSYVPDMKFRLADLYFEDSETNWLARMEEYNRLEAQLANNPTATLPEPPLKDYRRSIGLYRELVANYPDYANVPDALYLLGWCLSAQNAEQFDESAARDVYLAITTRFPTSPFANDANMRLGEYYFDQPGTAEDPTASLRVAIGYYERVLKDGPGGRNFDEAIYKLGWAHYKLNEYERSLAYMVQLLDYSDQQFKQSGKASNMRPEAVEYLAITYADIADRTQRPPAAVADEHLGGVGKRPWQHDVVERLAVILDRYAKWDQAIDVYAFLQRKWPLDPKNPVYQYEIAKLYRKIPPSGDEAASGAALAELAEKYSSDTEWYRANLGNPDALATAREYIEGSLAAVATEDLLRAQQSGKVEDYKLAASKYKEFLEKYPFNNEYDTYQWYYALSLFASNQFPAAAEQYKQIIKNERSPFRDGARYQRMKALEEIVRSAYGKLEEVPSGAIVERVETTPWGKQTTRFLLSDEHKAFIEACDEIAEREFTDPEWVPVLEKNRSALLYVPAQILHNHGHREEATARFEKLLARYYATREAEFAAALIVARYQEEGNLAKVLEQARRFRESPPGVAGQREKEFSNFEEQAAYNLAAELVKNEKFAEAAEAFLKFTRDFPQSQYIKEATRTAANNLDRAGRSEEAIRLYETYIQRWPSDENSKFLYFRIAQTYSSILDLGRAIQYYEQLVKLFPGFEDTPAAMFNAAFLRVGIGDHEGAARGYERYARTYPEKDDAESTAWKAGEQWKLVSEAAALAFYQDYVRRYGNTKPDHLVEAHYRIVKIFEGRGDARRAAQAQDQLQAAFRANVASGLNTAVRSMAAEGALAEIQARFDAFKSYKYSKQEKANVELILQEKPAELAALTDYAVQMIQEYQDFDTASASLYFQGMAYFVYADLVYNAPPPAALSDEEIAIYQQQLDSYRIPAEDKGKARLIACLEKARSEKRWGAWNSRVVDALHERYPLEYPSERKETRGAIPSSPVPMAGPQSVEAPPAGGGP